MIPDQNMKKLKDNIGYDNIHRKLDKTLNLLKKITTIYWIFYEIFKFTVPFVSLNNEETYLG